MFKISKIMLIVDSVEKAIKFYTEKLLFSITGLNYDKEGGVHLSRAEVRKGKFYIVFRLPVLEELAEFGVIRRSFGRATTAVAIAKKGIHIFYRSCKKKGVEIATTEQNPAGKIISFSVRDPFGLKLIFTESDQAGAFDLNDFYGMATDGKPLVIKKDSDVPADLVKWLRKFGISRRAAKKYIKLWAKAVA
jgi:catechol 2,3-dioxygenase-like lactoylglutathione lyase family enzyme